MPYTANSPHELRVSLFKLLRNLTKPRTCPPDDDNDDDNDEAFANN